jgi:hypothetical protein
LERNKNMNIIKKILLIIPLIFLTIMIDAATTTVTVDGSGNVVNPKIPVGFTYGIQGSATAGQSSLFVLYDVNGGINVSYTNGLFMVTNSVTHEAVTIDSIGNIKGKLISTPAWTLLTSSDTNYTLPFSGGSTNYLVTMTNNVVFTNTSGLLYSTSLEATNTTAGNLHLRFTFPFAAGGPLTTNDIIVFAHKTASALCFSNSLGYIKLYNSYQP